MRSNFCNLAEGAWGLVADSPDDLWFLYNLIHPGDRLRTASTRKVAVGRDGQTENEKLILNLTLRLDGIDYSPGDASLRVRGTNVTENEFVALGQHHAASISVGQKFVLTKDEWSEAEIERVRAALTAARAPNTVVLAMVPGEASLCLVSDIGTDFKRKITKSIPKKRPTNGKKREQSTGSFFDLVANALISETAGTEVKSIIVAGPGPLPKQFVTELLNRPDCPSYYRTAITTTHATSASHGTIIGLLKDPAILASMESSSMKAAVDAWTRLTLAMAKTPEFVVCGLGPVSRLAENGGVAVALVADKMLRVPDVEARRQLDAMIENIKANSGESVVVPSIHEIGKRIIALGGVAAVARWEWEDEGASDDFEEGSTWGDSEEEEDDL